MRTSLYASWLVLGLIHLPPTAVALFPKLASSLYGTSLEGDVGLLLRHRSVLFGSLVALAAIGFIDAASRRAASLAIAVSMVGYLALYLDHGAPVGPLRRVAIADALGLPALVLVLVDAWRDHP